jgi:hypothetical protein
MINISTSVTSSEARNFVPSLAKRIMMTANIFYGTGNQAAGTWKK